MLLVSTPLFLHLLKLQFCFQRKMIPLLVYLASYVTPRQFSDLHSYHCFCKFNYFNKVFPISPNVFHNYLELTFKSKLIFRITHFCYTFEAHLCEVPVSMCEVWCKDFLFLPIDWKLHLKSLMGILGFHVSRIFSNHVDVLATFPGYCEKGFAISLNQVFWKWLCMKLYAWKKMCSFSLCKVLCLVFRRNIHYIFNALMNRSIYLKLP